MRLLVVTRWRSPAHPLARFAAEASGRVPTVLVCGYEGGRADVPVEALAVDVGAGPWVSLGRAVRQARRRHRADVLITDVLDVDFDMPTVGVVERLVPARSRGLRTWLDERTLHQRLRRLSRVVVPSRHAASMLEAVGVDGEKVRVVPHALPAEPPVVERGHDEVVRVVSAAPIEAARGHHVAIDAVARLGRTEKRALRLDVVGPVVDPIYLDQLKVQAWEQPVHIHTDVEAYPLVAAADLAVFPTLRDEGAADDLIAAMAHDVPAVWAEQPALRELTAGEGFAVDADAEALRDLLRALLADPEPFRARGRVGGALVRERYGWHAVWPLWERVLDELMAG